MWRFIKDFPQVVSRLVDRIDSPAIQDTLLHIIACEEAGVNGVVEVRHTSDNFNRYPLTEAFRGYISGFVKIRSLPSCSSCSRHMRHPLRM
jgi:hypothetical protein